MLLLTACGAVPLVLEKVQFSTNRPIAAETQRQTQRQLHTVSWNIEAGIPYHLGIN